MADAACMAVEAALPAGMEEVPTPRLVLGCVFFLLFVVLNSFEAVPWLPVGRMGATLVGATLMALFVVPPQVVYGAVACNVELLVVLFGMLLISHFLRQARVLQHMEWLLLAGSLGRADLLLRVILLGAVTAALLIWDTASILLAPLIFQVCRKRRLPWRPYLIALIGSINIGSAWTPVGNPANIVAVSLAGIPFGDFMARTTVPVLVSLLLCAAVIAAVYHRTLFITSDDDIMSTEWTEEQAGPAAAGEVPSEDASPLPGGGNAVELMDVSLAQEGPGSQPEPESGPASSSACPAVADGSSSSQASAEYGADVEAQQQAPAKQQANHLQRRSPQEAALFLKDQVLPYLAMVAVFALWFVGYDLGIVALAGGVGLLVVVGWGTVAPQLLASQDYVLLTYIAGILVTVNAFNFTGVPASLWGALNPYVSLEDPAGVAVLVLVILLIVNIVTNVPTIFVVGPSLAAIIASRGQYSQQEALIFASYVICLAGNATVNGSVCQIICMECFRGKGKSFTFLEHLLSGFSISLVTLAVSVPILVSLL